jgi:hypothetical protein
MSMTQLDLIRDVLDKQLVDADGIEMGRVDGIVVTAVRGEQPSIEYVELGFVVLAERLHWRLAKLVERLRRWSVRATPRESIFWTKVEDVDRHRIKVDVKAENTAAFDWEKWLRRHVVEHLPGGKGSEQEDQ